MIGKVLVYECIAYSPAVNQGMGGDFFVIEGQSTRHDEMVSVHCTFFDGYVFDCGARDRKYIC
jgi:hypothetical protein